MVTRRRTPARSVSLFCLDSASTDVATNRDWQNVVEKLVWLGVWAADPGRRDTRQPRDRRSARESRCAGHRGSQSGRTACSRRTHGSPARWLRQSRRDRRASTAGTRPGLRHRSRLRRCRSRRARLPPKQSTRVYGRVVDKTLAVSGWPTAAGCRVRGSFRRPPPPPPPARHPAHRYVPPAGVGRPRVIARQVPHVAPGVPVRFPPKGRTRDVDHIVAGYPRDRRNVGAGLFAKQHGVDRDPGDASRREGGAHDWRRRGRGGRARSRRDHRAGRCDRSR